MCGLRRLRLRLSTRARSIGCDYWRWDVVVGVVVRSGFLRGAGMVVDVFNRWLLTGLCLRLRLLRLLIWLLLFGRLLNVARLSTLLPTSWLLLAHTMHASSWIDVVVDSPVRALAAVGERTGNFLKAWVQREVVADRVLSAPVSIRGRRAEIVNDGQQIKPLKQKQRR